MAALQHVYCPFHVFWRKNIRAFRNFSTSVNFHLDLSKGPTSLVEIPMRSQKANWNKIIQNQLLFSFPKHTDFHGFHQHFDLGRLGDSLDWLLYESGCKSQLWLHVFHQRLVLGKSNMSSSPNNIYTLSIPYWYEYPSILWKSSNLHQNNIGTLKIGFLSSFGKFLILPAGFCRFCQASLVKKALYLLVGVHSTFP